MNRLVLAIVALSVTGVVRAQDNFPDVVYGEQLKSVMRLKARGIIHWPETKSNFISVTSELAKDLAAGVPALERYIKGRLIVYSDKDYYPGKRDSWDWYQEERFLRDECIPDITSLLKESSSTLRLSGLDPNLLLSDTLKLKPLAEKAADVVKAISSRFNFPDVPDNHWVYETTEGFKKHGLLVGYPSRLGTGPRLYSRAELAETTLTAVDRLEPFLKQRLADLNQIAPIEGPATKETYFESSKPFLQKYLREDLLALIKEFSKELIRIGNRPTSLVAKIDAQMPLARRVADAIDAADVRQKLDSIFVPDIPDNHWIYETAETFTKAGFGHPEAKRFRGAQPLYRLAVCRWINQNVKALEPLLRDQISGKAPMTIPGHYDQTFYADFGNDLQALIKEFAPDLKACGKDPKAMLQSVEKCRPLMLKLPVAYRQALAAAGRFPDFPDVPYGHWAADAAKGLQRARVIVGYPDVTYRGGKE